MSKLIHDAHLPKSVRRSWRGSCSGDHRCVISLPLKSPDDIIFNAASVGFGSLAVGVATGIVWHWSGGARLTDRRYLSGAIAVMAIALAIAAGAQTQFDNAVQFTVPVAVITAVIAVIGTPVVAMNERIGIWTSGLLVIVAVALSLALAGQADQESGSLSLPPPP